METLFQIQQTGVKGKITEGSGYKKQILISHDNKFSTQIKEFKNGNYITTNLNDTFTKNKSNTIFVQVINKLNNTSRSLEFNLEQQSTVPNFKRLLANHQNNEILCLYYEKQKSEQYRITQEMLDILKDLGTNQFYPLDQEMNPYFCYSGIIYKQKIIQEQCSYINQELSHEFQFNTIADIGSLSFSKNYIPDSKVNFTTKNEQEIITEFDLPGNTKYLHFSGMIKKNMNILSGYPDAQFEIQQLNSTGAQVNVENNIQLKSAYLYSEVDHYTKILSSTRKIKIILHCKNALTVPGDLELRNLQLYCSNNKFNHQEQDNNYKDKNFLTAIQTAGIQTNQFNEQIGFNPRNFEEYKKEYNQNQNLFRDKNLPVIVDEPIKIFNEIIDNNKLRTVIKSTQNTQQVQLPSVEVDPYLSYIIGVWVNTKNKSNIQLQIQCSSDVKQFVGDNIAKNTQILLDEQNIQVQDYKFFYGFIYPYGLRNQPEQENLKLLQKIDQQLSEIQVEHSVQQKRGIICLDNKNFNLTPTIQFNSENQVSGTIVMPILKDLQIAQFRRDSITAINLQEQDF